MRRETTTAGETHNLSVRSYDTWNDELRALPNDLIRSSLFGISGRDQRVLVREIFTNKDVHIYYKGIGYDQIHFDVFAAVAHLARGIDAGGEIHTTRYHLLKVMNRTAQGKRNYSLLYKRLTDLQVGTLMIARGDKVMSRGPLLQKVDIDKQTGALTIRLNPEMRSLFDAATRIQWSQRTSLTSSLDKWLHAFFASHAKVLPIKVETYMKFCGSSAKKNEFKRMLTESMSRLKDRGYIEAFSINEKEHVLVKKKPTQSQERHLTKRKRRSTPLSRYFARVREAEPKHPEFPIDLRAW